jgi:hypothetical protein
MSADLDQLKQAKLCKSLRHLASEVCPQRKNKYFMQLQRKWSPTGKRADLKTFMASRQVTELSYLVSATVNMFTKYIMLFAMKAPDREE